VENFRISPLSEDDINAIIQAAGGCRAHPAADKRHKPGVDYLLVESLIELKLLDEEGLGKPQRQTKLAALFRDQASSRPVIVLDREKLSEHGRRDYDRILEGPIKSGVAKAKDQLKQSRLEHPSAKTGILLVVNNGYTALSHESLLRMVAHRARQDTREIDGVVVAGCYFYSDTFDSSFQWPIEYVPINIDRPFSSFESLRLAWIKHAEKLMTAVVKGEMPPDTIKGPVIDTQFDLDGVTYVKPAPPMGGKSGFFRHGRPRLNSSAFIHCPPVAITFPDMTRDEWQLFRHALPDEGWFQQGYEPWRAERVNACSAGTPFKPFAPILVTHQGWDEWCAESRSARDLPSLRCYANHIFGRKIQALIDSARERSPSLIMPPRYVLAVTEEIGQDRANDVSRVSVVREMPNCERLIRAVITDARIFHEYAVAIASAYAVVEGIDFVLWEKDLTYAWI
jgi:hypothetical protein